MLLSDTLGGSGPSAPSPLVYVGSATKGLRLKKSFVLSISANSAIDPKEAFDFVGTFSHYFFDLYASRDAEFFGKQSRYSYTHPLTNSFQAALWMF